MQWVPPVHSPVPPGALLRGAKAALAGGEPHRNALRRLLRDTYGCRRAVLVDSGTSALALALRASPVGPGGARTVALPAYCCYDLVTAARGAGARAVAYDLDPATLAPDPDSLARALDAGARAVVVAHLYGVPVAMEAVEGAARRHGALVVEDAAQGVGGRLAGGPLGSRGPLSVLSFGRGKGLSGGGGGALLVHDPELAGPAEPAVEAAERAGAGRGGGALLRSAVRWLLGRPGLYGLPSSLPFLRLGETIYREPHPVAGLPAACAGTVVGAWEASFREAEGRRARAGALRDRAAGSGEYRAVRVPEGGRAGWLRLPVIARSEEAARRLSSSRARGLGVMPGYPRILPALPAFPAAEAARAPRNPEAFPGARRLTRRLFTLPVHGRLSARHLRRLGELIA